MNRATDCGVPSSQDDDSGDASALPNRRALFRGAVVLGVAATGVGATVGPAWAAGRSQNGWAGITSSSSAHLNRGFTVNGVEFPSGVREGAASTILRYVATQFDERVERLRPGWCWGWNYRPIRGATALSNHASATAIDCNAPLHPMGKANTFSPAQRRQIEAILRYCDGVVRWGGDYHGRKDEMHFEINVRPGDPSVGTLARKIRGERATKPAVARWPILRRGATGFRVVVLQYLLRHRGRHIAVDGAFGSQTRAAVVDFQRSRRLAVDGVAGPQTWAALVAAVEKGDRGYAVRATQTALRAHKNRLAVDGIFGARTHRILVGFQRNHDLAAGGVVNARTWRALI